MERHLNIGLTPLNGCLEFFMEPLDPLDVKNNGRKNFQIEMGAFYGDFILL